MAIKYTAPEINIREKLVELDKPSGVAGEAMLRSETPQEQFNLIGAGRKNIIINGDFKVSQRGDFSSASGAINNTYWIDRFQTIISGISANKSILYNTVVNGKETNVARLEATSSSIGYMGNRTQIEASSLTVGETYTVSCWMRTNISGTQIRLNHFTLFDDVAATHSGSGKWEYLSGTVKFNGEDPSSNNLVRIFFGLTYTDNSPAQHNSGDYIEVAHCQLEVGSVATPFEYRHKAEELALCQRYYQRLTNGRLFALANGSSSWIVNGGQLPVKMRADGTIGLTYANGSSFNIYSSGTGTQTTNVVTGGGWSAYNGTNVTANVAGSGTNVTSGHPGWIDLGTTSGQLIINIDAEL